MNRYTSQDWCEKYTESLMPLKNNKNVMYMREYMGPAMTESAPKEDLEKEERADEQCNGILAHSYVPWQSYEQAFSPGEALMKGTLFPELWGVYPIPE